MSSFMGISYFMSAPLSYEQWMYFLEMWLCIKLSTNSVSLIVCLVLYSKLLYKMQLFWCSVIASVTSRWKYSLFTCWKLVNFVFSSLHENLLLHLAWSRCYLRPEVRKISILSNGLTNRGASDCDYYNHKTQVCWYLFILNIFKIA